MRPFREYLSEEKTKPYKRSPYKRYPYKLKRWVRGQKKRSVAMSNAHYQAQKALKKKVADTRRKVAVYRKKKKR